MKNCTEYQQLLLEHLYGLLEEDQRRDLEAHLADCPACQSAQERAYQEQRWLAQAACWSFEDVRFEAPPLSVLAPQQTEAGKPAWASWIQEHLPLWLLAACLLLACGLAIWLATSTSHLAPDWAMRSSPPDRSALESDSRKSSGPLTGFAEPENLTSTEPIRAQVQQFAAAPRSADKSASSLCEAELQSAHSPTEKQLRRGIELSPGAPVQQADAGLPRGQAGSLLQAPQSAPAEGAFPGRPGSGTGPAVDRPAAEKAALALDSGKPKGRSAGAAIQGATRQENFPAGLSLAERFAVVRVVASPADRLLAQVEILDFPLSRWEHDNLSRQALADAVRNAPALLPSTSVNSNATVASPAGPQSLLVPQQIRPGFENAATNNLQVIGRDRVPVESLQHLQQWTVRLPKQEGNREAWPEIEVPIESGSLSRCISQVRLPMNSFAYLPAVACLPLPQPEELFVQVIPVEPRELRPLELITEVKITMTDDLGQQLAPEVGLERRRYAVRPGNDTANAPTFVSVYQTRLRRPANAPSGVWLHLRDTRGLLTPLQLHWKLEPGGSKPVGWQHTPLGVPLAAFAFDTITDQRGPTSSVMPMPAQECNDLILARTQWCSASPNGSASDEAIPFSLVDGLVCRDHDQALLLAHAHRQACRLERSLVERLRQYARQQQTDQPVLTSPTPPFVPGQPPRRVPGSSLSANDSLGQLLSQWLDRPTTSRRWLFVLETGLVTVLIGLCAACGIFGSVSGSRLHLRWWRRSLVMLLVLVAAWLAWTAVQAHTNPERRQPNTLEPVGLRDCFLAQTNPDASSARPGR